MITFDIDEQESGKYLVYYKKETDEVDSLVMGMIENNKIEGTVPFMKTQVDTVVSYRYDITGLQPVTEYFSGIVSKNKILTVIEEILEEKKLLEEYMLGMDAVVLENRCMFVEPATGKVKCLLLPVKHENLPMDIFFRNMIFSVQYNPEEDVSYVTKILNYFNGAETFSAIGFEKIIKELKGRRTNVQVQRSVTPVLQNVPVQATAVSAVQPFQIQNPGTTILNSSTVHTNVQHYVNPNLSQGQNHAINANTSIPKTYPGTNQGTNTDTRPVEQQEVSVKEKKGLFGKKDKGEKSKSGLFGKKEKPENTKVETQDRPKSFHGIAIPGSDVVEKPENTVTQPTAIPVQNVSIPVHAAPIQYFGETIDLKSYIDTSVAQGNVGANPVRNAFLIRKSTKEQFHLTKAVTKVGRSRENVDIYITDNTSIGRVHATLYLQNGRVFIEDQQSKNGTFLNGHRVVGQEEVTPGSNLRMSNEEFEIVFS